MTYLWSFINDGGLLMYPLLALSIIGLGVIIERLVVYRRWNEDRPALLQELEQALPAQGPEGVVQTLSARKGLLSRMLMPLFEYWNQGLTAMRKATTEDIELNIRPDLARRLSLLSTIGKISPLIGLFGTVQGMIGAFSKISGSSGDIKPQELSSDISVALYTTFAGLFVAIPVLSALAYFRTRVQRFEIEMEKTRLWAMDLATQQKRTGGSARAG